MVAYLSKTVPGNHCVSGYKRTPDAQVSCIQREISVLSVSAGLRVLCPPLELFSPVQPHPVSLRPAPFFVIWSVIYSSVPMRWHSISKQILAIFLPARVSQQLDQLFSKRQMMVKKLCSPHPLIWSLAFDSETSAASPGIGWQSGTETNITASMEDTALWPSCLHRLRFVVHILCKCYFYPSCKPSLNSSFLNQYI